MSLAVEKHLMMIYLVNANFILAERFRNKTKEELAPPHQKLEKELDKRAFVMNLHVLDNESP